jgi:hypothetical protein
VALGGTSGTTGTLRGFLSRSLRQEGSGDVRRPAEVDLALANRRRRTLGTHPSLWPVPAYRSLARWGCCLAVRPCGASDGGVVGSLWLMEGYGCRRSHPLAPANGGLLLSDEAAADGPRPHGVVGGHNRADVGTGHGLKEVRSISRLGPCSPKSRRDLLEICLNSSGSSPMCKADQLGSQRVNRSVPIDNRSVRQKAVGISPLENLRVSCSRFQPFGTLVFTRVRGRISPKVKCRST